MDTFAQSLQQLGQRQAAAMLPAEGGRRGLAAGEWSMHKALLREPWEPPSRGLLPTFPSKSSPRSTSCKSGTSGTMPFPGNGSPALGHPCPCDLRSPGHVRARQRKAGAFHRWPSGPRPQEVGKIRDIGAGGSLRNRQHSLSQESRTPDILPFNSDSLPGTHQCNPLSLRPRTGC